MGKWKNLRLEGKISSKDLEGLVGIQELSDYDCEKLIKRKRPLKYEPDSTEDGKSKVKKKKTKQKKSNKKSEKPEQNDPLPEDIAEDDEIKEDAPNMEVWESLGAPKVVIQALADEGFSTPTLIQSLALPSAILGKRDILGAAETGSGKTLAFGIPIINGILEQKKKLGQVLEKPQVFSKNEEEDDSDDDEEIEGLELVRISKLNEKEENLKPLYALILTPTRELAIQIQNHLKKAVKYTDFLIAVVVGGMAVQKQERVLSKGPEIVIATPGRLWELFSDGNPHIRQIDKIKFLAIDETDRMFEKSHFEELHSILAHINADEENTQQRQNFVFSATLTMVHDIPEYLQRKKKCNPRSKIFKISPGQKLQEVISILGIKNPKVIDVTKEKGTAENLTECRITCSIDHKDYYLFYFLKRHVGRTLVFCNSIGCVQRLSTLFGILGCNPMVLHAKMIQRQRLKNLERFQEDERGLLIATDVAARGLDIPNVEHVIHYQVPRTSESYVHRSGRTARAQKEGLTLLLMEPSEAVFYSRLCHNLGRSEDLPMFPVVDQLLVAVKERVNVAREIDQLELKYKRNNIQKDWLKKAAEDMDLLLDEDESESTMGDKDISDIKKLLKGRKSYLSKLLRKPLFPGNFSGKYLDTKLQLNLETSKTAIETMKKAMNEGSKKKKLPSIAEARKSRIVLKRKLKNDRRSKKREQGKKNVHKSKE